MVLRWLSALGIAAAILFVLAIPLSIVRLTLDYRSTAQVTLLYLSDGSLGVHHWPRRGAVPPRPADTLPRYDIEAGFRSQLRSGLPAWHWWLPEHTVTGGVFRASIPLVYLIAICLAPLGLHAWLVRRAELGRKRLGLCRSCGYDLRASEERCPECGSPVPTDRTAVRPPPARRLGVLPVLVCLVLMLALLVSGLVALDAHEVRSRETRDLRGLDYAWYSYETTPRLSGQIEEPASIATSGQPLPAGALLLIEDGEVDLGHALLTDATLIGLSPNRSRLKLILSTATRVRLSNLTIDCNNHPFCDFRDSAALQVSGCEVIRYNSGAGGSNAIYGQAATMLIDGCTFNGTDGNAAGSLHAVAFDLRGPNLVYVRKTQFIENNEIARAESGVFDRCTSTTAGGAGYGVQIYTGPVYGRGNNLGVFPRDVPTPLSLASDDAAYVAAARANKRSGDSLADKMMRRLRPHSDPRYWCGLLRHEDQQVRQAARERLTELGFGALLKPPAVDVPAALERIAAGAGDANDLRLSILARGPAALEPLRRAAQDGTGAVKRSADLLLRVLEAAPTLQDEAIFTRVARELDK